jgi:ribosomal small subunit protein bTHX
MGKGDRKSRRGKINSGSYGKKRPRKASKSFAASTEKSKA